MSSLVYWIDSFSVGRLAIVARPRGGDWLRDEVAAWRESGIDTVVDLLTVEERQDLDLREQPTICHSVGIEHVSFSISDRGVPDDRSAVKRLVHDILRQASNGKSIGVHCRAGIGRSALITACVLVESEQTSEDAFATIATARGVRVPDTEEQRAWVHRYKIDL